MSVIYQFNTIVHDEVSLAMKAYASQNNIPIIQDQGLELLLQLLRIKKPQTILEIGTAIGYSSLMMARHLPDCQIVTIEREEDNYLATLRYHGSSNVGGRITTIFGDALELSVANLPIGLYDVIFIDAAKAQYRKFFEKYEALLNDDGMIISDNLLFHGHVLESNRQQSRNLKQLVRKIKDYISWLAQHPHYDTQLLPISDGIAVSLKKTEVSL